MLTFADFAAKEITNAGSGIRQPPDETSRRNNAWYRKLVAAPLRRAWRGPAASEDHLRGRWT